MKRKKIIVGRIGFIAIGLFLLSLYLKETFQYAFFYHLGKYGDFA